MLRAYFDASFSEPPGVTSIAGYIGSEQQWANVEDVWAENLDLWGLENFHLAELPRWIGHENADLCALSFLRAIEPLNLRSIDAALVDVDWDQMDKDG